MVVMLPVGVCTSERVGVWVCPCRISSAPWRARTFWRAALSTRRLRHLAVPGTGGWWMSRTRRSPCRRVSSSRGPEPGQLLFAKAANREIWGARHCRGETDQGDLAAHPQAREEIDFAGTTGVVRSKIRGPHGAGAAPGAARVGFVVARDDGDPIRGSQIMEPSSGLGKFLGETEMRQIAGHGHMVGAGKTQVFKQSIDDGAGMDDPPLAPPREVSQQTLVQQLRDLCVLQRGQVQVGEVGQGEAVAAGRRQLPRGGLAGGRCRLCLYFHHAESI